MKQIVEDFAAKNFDDIERIETIEEIQNENEHIINLWEPLDFNIDSRYEYIPKGKVFSLL